MPRAPPGVEYEAVLKWFTVCGDHDAIVFAWRPCTRDAPMQVQCGEIQGTELRQQIFRPVEAQPSLLEAHVDQEIVEERWPDGAVFPGQLP